MIRNLVITATLLFLLLVGMMVNDRLSVPSKHLIIFYTSNLRGQINPFSGQVKDRQYDKVGGLAFIKGLIDETLARYHLDSRYVLLLDTGDSIFGSAEASLTLGEVPFEMMGKTGYDAMAVGNMEFEFGMDLLRKFANAGAVPMLACNYRDLKAPIGNTFLPGRIIDRQGVKVGVIGLGHAELSRNTRQENILDVEVTDLQASVQKAASTLKMQGAEILVLLSHHPALDMRPDLPHLFPEIDVVIGDLIGGAGVSTSTRPLICQTAPARGSGLGMVKIPYIGTSWNLAKAFRTILPVDASQVVPDAGLVGEISRLEAKIDTLLEEVVVTSQGDFQRQYNDESPIGDLIADCMAATAKADVALQNSGGIKATISSGPVSLRDLYDILPFENMIVKVALKGWQLENLIEESLSERGSFLQGSGVQCTYSSRNPPGFRIIQISVKDEPLEFDKVYQVAVNDFMLNNLQAWPDLARSDTPQPNGLLRESLKTYLKGLGTISPNLHPRFTDIQDQDETLRVQALSFEIASLSRLVTHDGTVDSEYGRLLADVLRTEVDADFALVSTAQIRAQNDPLGVLTPGLVLSHLPEPDGVRTAEVQGSQIQSWLETSLATGVAPLCFAGFSLEIHADRSVKIFPWEGDFDPARVYKVVFPGATLAALPGGQDIGKKGRQVFSDLRRCFVNGLRRRNGRVELRRAIF